MKTLSIRNLKNTSRILIAYLLGIFMIYFPFYSKGSVKLYNVPIGGKIPELSQFKPQEDERAWPKELAVSALYYTGELTTGTLL